ncbi:hypothetical protein DJICPGNB_26055 [Escherichia coli]|nr:hypothetical protein DJICPGNB_26055 [Escherichia coli]
MQTRMIKLADLLDNTSSIVSRDPEFSAIYLAEKELMLDVHAGRNSVHADVVSTWRGMESIEHPCIKRKVSLKVLLLWPFSTHQTL